MAERKVIYSEPDDYIPKSVRKEMKLGEYADDQEQEKEKANKEIRNFVNNK